MDGGRRHRDELPGAPLPSLTKLGATMESWRVNRGMLEVLVRESLLGIGPLPAWSSVAKHTVLLGTPRMWSQSFLLAMSPPCLETIDLVLLGSLREKENETRRHSSTG